MKKPGKTLQKLLLLVLNFIVIYGFLRLIIALGERLRIPAIYYAGSTVYMLALAGLFIAFFSLSGGTFQTKMPTADQLPEAWSAAEKQQWLDTLRENRKKARKLLYVLFPLVAAVGISYIELWFFV